MDLNPSQLAALVAIADCGSFEAAARQLHLTPSAISQRIRALESAAGQVLVSRGAPCVPTPRGERLVQLGRQTRLLHDEARQELGALTSVELPVAVNADSLGTWFRDVLGVVAGWEGVTGSEGAGRWEGTAILLHVEDQAYSQELLRRGDVLAAVTSDAVAVQGCAIEPLGAMRYVPAATPEFAARWRDGGRGGRGDGNDGGINWAAMPMLDFNEKDEEQRQQLRRRGVDQRPPIVHRLPSTADFYEAVRLGLGWGMLPELQAHADLDAGRLERLSDDVSDVPLYWQRWRVESSRLTKLTESVRRAARAHLRPA